MKLHKTTKISDTRAIEEIVHNGDLRYHIIYHNKIRHTIQIGDITLFSWNTTNKDVSDILFSSAKSAEIFAQKTSKCEEGAEFGYIIYPNGYETLQKYGYFYWEDRTMYDFMINDDNNWSATIEFRFYAGYKQQYGDYVWVQLYKFFSEKFDTIKYIVDKVHLNDMSKIVKKFDVVTLETLPLDKIKASSKEIEEMNKILEEFKLAQAKYTDILEKIYKNQ